MPVSSPRVEDDRFVDAGRQQLQQPGKSRLVGHFLFGPSVGEASVEQRGRAWNDVVDAGDVDYAWGVLAAQGRCQRLRIECRDSR